MKKDEKKGRESKPQDRKVHIAAPLGFVSAPKGSPKIIEALPTTSAVVAEVAHGAAPSVATSAVVADAIEAEGATPTSDTTQMAAQAAANTVPAPQPAAATSVQQAAPQATTPATAPTPAPAPAKAKQPKMKKEPKAKTPLDQPLPCLRTARCRCAPADASGRRTRCVNAKVEAKPVEKAP